VTDERGDLLYDRRRVAEPESRRAVVQQQNGAFDGHVR
jgi:hypothetical protein